MTPPRVFVIMPFAEEFDDLWQLGIRDTLVNLGCVCDRADAIETPGFIMSQIYDQIARADVIIAEMTGQNANVFYEVGYAHALDIPTVLCARDRNELRAFDTQSYRHILHQGRAHILRDHLNTIIPELITPRLRLPQHTAAVYSWPDGPDSPPILEWHPNLERTGGQYSIDELGGQALETTGRGEPLLVVRDTKVNWNHLPHWSITTLVRRSKAIRLGHEVLASLVLRTDGEADINMIGDGSRMTEGGTRVWAQGFPSVERRVASPTWAQIELASAVAPTDEGDDPTANGLSVYIRFRTGGRIWVRRIALYVRDAREQHTT
jgi:hypothetical protein